MINGKQLKPRDIGISCDQLTSIELMPLPAPFDKPENVPQLKEAKPEWKEKFNADLEWHHRYRYL